MAETVTAVDTPGRPDTAKMATASEVHAADKKQDISAAIAAYNERVEREGLFAEEHRRF